MENQNFHHTIPNIKFTNIKEERMHSVLNKLMKRFTNLCFSLAYRTLLLLCLGTTIVGAQDINLSPEQMAQLQALTPAQRQALLNSLSTPAVTQEQIAEPLDIEPRTPESNNSIAIERNIQIEQTNDSDSLQEEGATTTTNTELEQFGYSLFAGSPTTFAPATNIPVPANYIMGPGDTVIIQLYGQQNVTHELVITREGTLLLPEIGPIAVSGLSFDDLRAQIDEIVSTQLIGQQAAVTLGNLRSIRIFVLGEAFRPGSYTVSGLSTMTNALFVSGGITNVGSLRNIQLRRLGETIAELDLYDLLLEGDTSADQRLLPDDVLFVPPIGPTVAVSGEVIRPAIYEIKDEATTLEVLMLAGTYLHTTISESGGSHQMNGVSFHFQSNSLAETLKCEDIDLVVVSSRHHNHAQQVVAALQAGKHVFVEKPLCLEMQELKLIEEAYSR